jgi:uncharacterized membrane protein
MDDLGARFWLAIIGVTIAIAAAVFLILVFIGWAWYAWGLLGLLLVLGVVFAGIGLIVDRREAKRRRRLAA